MWSWLCLKHGAEEGRSGDRKGKTTHVGLKTVGVINKDLSWERNDEYKYSKPRKLPLCGWGDEHVNKCTHHWYQMQY